ncbi:hypothetical protein [Stieleria varia]|uniref:Uncharacterized protein n=1 Tax=Stieleria varia TaxID=2528005 RepID=A0A5C6A3A4_9BACT|nr:hypothetical protein [Stieleria varia]TWT93886.1 hypothetical protein Pla52n_57140 [Stieleria varia]
MSHREPVFLVVLIDTATLDWHVGGIRMDGTAVPLLRSDPESLAEYRNAEFDGQVSFLRHQLAGALQRGCDRLFPRDMKACHFLIVANGPFPDADAELSTRLAEHFVQWMISPPATYIILSDWNDDSGMNVVAGEMPESDNTLLASGLSVLVDSRRQPDDWEHVPGPSQSEAT